MSKVQSSYCMYYIFSFCVTHSHLYFTSLKLMSYCVLLRYEYYYQCWHTLHQGGGSHCNAPNQLILSDS